MKTRTLIITMLLLLAVSVSAFAQTANAPAKAQPRQGVAKIVKALDLNKDQAKQVRDIVAKLHQDVANVVKSTATKDQKKAQIKDLRTKAVDAVMAILTPDQQTKAKKMNLEQMIMAPSSAKRIGVMYALSQLNLTDQQKASIKSINEDSRKAAKAIQDDTSLDKAAKRAKLADLKKSTEDKVVAVLTPDQQQKLKDILAKEKQAAKDHEKSK